MRARAAVVVLLACFAAASLAQEAPRTELTFHADDLGPFEPEDTHFSGSDPDSQFQPYYQVRTYQLLDFVRIVVTHKGSLIHIFDFESMNHILTPGFDGTILAGCTPTYLRENGDVTILQAQTDDNTLRFAAVFDDTCVPYTARRHGVLYFNYTPTVDVHLSSDTISPGQTVAGTVTLPAPAPAGGAEIVLLSRSPEKLRVPHSVIIPAGERTASFEAYAIDGDSEDRTHQVLAIYEGVASLAEINMLALRKPLTLIEFFSPPGDFIGQGKHLVYDGSTGRFSIGYRFAGDKPSSGQLTYLDFEYFGYDFFWMFDFDSSKVNRTFPGHFENAVRYPFNPGKPGLSVAGSDTSDTIGRGCNELTGSFDIIDLTIDYSHPYPVVGSLAARFEQRCDTGPPLQGQIFYNYVPRRERMAKR